LKRFSVPAWIPDTLRSFLAHEVENDELHLGLSLISSVGRLALAVWRWRFDVGGLALAFGVDGLRKQQITSSSSSGPEPNKVRRRNPGIHAGTPVTAAAVQSCRS
jgi:hypothetical protein